MFNRKQNSYIFNGLNRKRNINLLRGGFKKLNSSLVALSPSFIYNNNEPVGVDSSGILRDFEPECYIIHGPVRFRLRTDTGPAESRNSGLYQAFRGFA